jgi:hypothetical protein
LNLNLQPFGLEATNWIPAFAGMTAEIDRCHHLNRTRANHGGKRKPSKGFSPYFSANPVTKDFPPWPGVTGDDRNSPP